MVLVLFLAFLLFGCTHERDNPYDPNGTNYDPSLFPSSSSSLSVLVPCMHTTGCTEISAEACFAFGGQLVAFCPAVSSSSLQAAVSSSSDIYNSSSSSLPEVMVLCMLSDGTCPLTLISISQEACRMFGGTPVQSCVGSSSSVPSSSSLGGGFSGSYGSLLYEGQTYKTVLIGTQTWMAENLNYAPSFGTFISCDTYDCSTYGRLYDWPTAMALPSGCNSTSCSNQIQSPHRGICPVGWHIPSDAEWTALTDYVGSTAGTKLKATSGWNSGFVVGTDEFGFSALPGGYGDSSGDFDGVGYSGNWWSAAEYGATIAYNRYMYYYFDSVDNSYNYKSFLYSVRCLQD